MDTQNFQIMSLLTYLYKQACHVQSSAKTGPMHCDTKKMFYISVCVCVCVCVTTDFFKQDKQ